MNMNMTEKDDKANQPQSDQQDVEPEDMNENLPYEQSDPPQDHPEPLQGSPTDLDPASDPAADQPRAEAGQRPSNTASQPAPSNRTIPADAPAMNTAKSSDTFAQPWFTREDVEDLQSRWNTIQVQFIDSPCSAVEQGEALLAETLERIKQVMSDRQNSLGKKWLNNDNISTEELRTALLNYRAFLNWLLGIK